MRSRHTAPAAAAIVILALSACSGADPASPAATAPGQASSATAPASSGAAVRAAGWPAYHGTMSRAGVSATMPAASGIPRRIQSLKLDGEVFASPIVVGGLTIVATEQDTVYAFDQSYRQVWKRSLGSPSPAEERQCGDINPLGITGTPVYDATTNHVFVVAEHGGSVRHELYALNAGSGRVAWSKSIDLPGVSARDMQQRGALAIADNRVWVSYGAQAGDCGNYKGRVVGVPLDGGSDVIFYSPPTRRGGGICDLGGIGGQVDVQNICLSFGGAAVDGDVVYLPCTDGVRAVRVDGAGQLHVLWHTFDSITGSPVIGGGRVWALDTSAGVLHALDPSTGKSLGQVEVGVANRFATPALYGADVIVPTLAGIAVVRTS